MFDVSVNQQPTASAIGWITDSLLGQTAATLCVLAVALVGFSMLTGRISLRRGGMVIVGCFVILGAPAIAQGLLALRNVPGESGARQPTVVYDAQPRAQLTPVQPSAAPVP